MKYSDEQRIQKIREYGAKLLDYMDKHHISKNDLIQPYQTDAVESVAGVFAGQPLGRKNAAGMD